MQQELEILNGALQRANKSNAFTLDEAHAIKNAFDKVVHTLKSQQEQINNLQTTTDGKTDSKKSK